MYDFFVGVRGINSTNHLRSLVEDHGVSTVCVPPHTTLLIAYLSEEMRHRVKIAGKRLISWTWLGMTGKYCRHLFWMKIRWVDLLADKEDRGKQTKWIKRFSSNFEGILTIIHHILLQRIGEWLLLYVGRVWTSARVLPLAEDCCNSFRTIFSPDCLGQARTFWDARRELFLGRFYRYNSWVFDVHCSQWDWMGSRKLVILNAVSTDVSSASDQTSPKWMNPFGPVY